MKNLNVIFLIAASLIMSAYACNQSKNMSSSSDNAKSDKSQDMGEGKTELEDKKDQMVNGKKDSKSQNVTVDPTYIVKSSDKFTLLESNVRGDILSLVVQYGGGCETHEWALKTNGVYAKSLPPQITLNLEHKANGDMCRALLTDTLKFNLENIKYPGTFQLDVKLKDFENHTITYRYK